LLIGCGVKPSASCSVNLEKETVKDITESCVKNPTVGVSKEF